MTTTGWIVTSSIVSLIVISYAVYWVWENNQQKLNAEISSGSEKAIDLQPADAPRKPISRPRSNDKPVTLDIEDLIHAQNRTTHAVRAFVRFLFIQLTGLTLAAFLWVWGISFLQFLAGGVWIVSVIWSSNAGWKELDKSGIGLEPETTKESFDKDPLEQDRLTTKICSCGAINSQNAKRCSDCGIKWLLAR